jgi:dihydrodipicolinate synthase/N-acetylneuraminate lyase
MFFQIENVVAVKVAPFNRYQTLDVIYALAESGRNDIALYTGNDDTIIHDLITPFVIGDATLRFCGGLLGHWSVWTSSAVDVWKRCRAAVDKGAVDVSLLADAAAVTELNRVLFDADNGFAGCIAGIHDVLMRQGLMSGTWCLDAAEGMSPGQAAALRQAELRYPHLTRF